MSGVRLTPWPPFKSISYVNSSALPTELPIQLKVKQCNNVKEMDDHRWCLSGDALKFGVPAPVKNLLLTMAK